MSGKLKYMLIRLKASNTGQAIVEFAICLPLLIIILSGIIDFGWIFMNEYQVHNSAFEGARYAEMHMYDTAVLSGIAPDQEIKNYVDQLVRSSIPHRDSDDPDKCTVEVIGLYTTDFPYVRVKYKVPMLSVVGHTLFGEEFEISAVRTFSGVRFS